MVVMKKTGRTWLATALLAVCVFGQGKSESAEKRPASKVAEIIERYVQASGGSALAEIKSETRKGTLLRGVKGKVPFETAAKAPGKWYYGQTFAWGEQVGYGCDGNDAWVRDNHSISGMSSRQGIDMKLLLDFQAPLKIRVLFPEMTLKGPEKVSGRDVTAIAATSKDGFQTELAFDDETGFLVRAGEMMFEDYRDVGPVRRPFRIRLGRDEGEKHLVIVMEFSEIRHDLKVDDTLFRRPACVFALSEAPLFKQRNRMEIKPESLAPLVGQYRHPERPEIVYTVTRQQNHLMLGRTDWYGQKFEIMPESGSDFFIEFLNQEFHFIKDEAGRVTHLEIWAGRMLKAERIE